MTMVAENATGLRNLFKLSSLASFEGQLGKWSRMDAEIIAEHAAGIIATTGCPSGEVQTRLRLGHEREALESAAKWREIFGPENYFLELMDHGLDDRAPGPRGPARDRPQARHPAAGHQRLPLRHPGGRRATTRRCCACRPARRCRIPTGSSSTATATTSSPPPRCARCGTTEVPGACDSTLLIAERVQSYAEVWAPKDRMPVFPVPDGHDQASWLRHEVAAGLASAGSRPACRQDYIDRADYEIDGHLRQGLSRRTSSSSPT